MWCAEKLLEDNLYWILAQWRWLDPANATRMADLLLAKVPWPMRPLLKAAIQCKMRKNVQAQGAGRHTLAEQLALAKKSMDSLSAILADKPYLMGAKPCGADATVFAFMAGIFCLEFTTPLSSEAEKYANLVSYVERMRAQYLSTEQRAVA